MQRDARGEHVFVDHEPRVVQPHGRVGTLRTMITLRALITMIILPATALGGEGVNMR